MPNIAPNDFAKLARAAALAPSADNRHRWKLRCKGSQIVFETPQLQDEGVTQRHLAFLSLGAASENIRIRARALGLSISLELAPEDTDSTVVCKTEASEPEVDNLDEAISLRHTNRSLFYGRRALSPDARRQLEEEADYVPHSQVNWHDGSDQRRAACKLVLLAEVERFRIRALHDELFSSIRFDLGLTDTADIGLPPGALSISSFEYLAFRKLKRWRMQRVANMFGAHWAMAFRSAALPTWVAPNLCTISSTMESETGAFEAGRLLQRVWCRSTLMGLACQVLAASPIYALPGASDIDPRLQRRLAAGWAPLCTEGRPFVALRLGHAPTPSVRAGRQSVEELISGFA